jgi:hypothetical protein
MSEFGNIRHFDLKFSVTFESYGLRIRLESNRESLLEKMAETSRDVLLGNFEIIENEKDTIHQLGLAQSTDGHDEHYAFYRDDEHLTTIAGEEEALELFIRLLRIKVAEFAKDCVFLHAGVVGWNNKAIVLPADSGSGKTSLVIELVKLGAAYYSDEYAVLDKNGMVHPFARKLSVRSPGNVWSEKNGIPIEEFGGKAATKPIDIGLVLFAKYEPNASWSPEVLTTGEGMMEAIGHTIPLRVNTEFSLNVLKNALSRAIILRGSRGEASKTAKHILSYIEDRKD